MKRLPKPWITTRHHGRSGMTTVTWRVGRKVIYQLTVRDDSVNWLDVMWLELPDGRRARPSFHHGLTPIWEFV